MLSGFKVGGGTDKINRNRWTRRRAMLAAASAATVGITAMVQTPARATTYVWNNTGTAWTNPADWSVGTGYPGSTGTTDIAVFNGPAGTFQPTLSGTALSLGELDFSLSNSSGYTLSSNSSSATFALYSTGTGASSAIFANNSSGTNTISAPLILDAGDTFTQANGGTLNITGGISAAGTGENLTLAGGGVFNFNTAAVNLNGTGTGTAGGILGVGTIAGSAAVLNISSSSSITALDLAVGNGTGTSSGGAVYQTGGSLTLTDNTAGTGSGSPDKEISLGGTGSTGTAGYGYYALSGGTLSANQMDIGARAAGTVGVMDVSGGAISIGGNVNMGRGNNGGANYGLLNITGGNVSINTAVATDTLGMGFTGTGAEVINVGGGSGAAALTGGNSASSGIEFTVQTAIENEVNLLPNGTLTVARIFGASANATALVNFNGGDLKATASNAGTTFLATNIGAVTVYSNGGTIDNSGTNITIGNALVAPAGSGVSSITPSGGSGYIGAPFVYISGGGGTGATAYAVMSGGTISNIVITNPGTGYTSAPTVTLVGGGAGTAATATAGSPTVNSTSGGMTFVGTGTTTLNGVNTYTGLTTVSAGTLQIASTGSLAGAVSVSPNATFVTAGPTAGATSIGSNAIFVPGAASYNGATGIPTVTLSATGIYNTGPLTIQKTSTVDFAFNSSANAEVNVNGSLTLNGGILDFTNSGAATSFTPPISPATYTLITYSSGQFNGSLGNFTIANAQAGKAYSFANTGSAITLTIANSSSGSWTNATTDELWTDSGNWVGGSIPNAIASTAIFGSSLANGDGNVNLANTNETVGSLSLDNTSTPGNVSFNIESTGTGILILNNGTSASPILDVVAGTHTISAPLQLNAPVSGGTTFSTGAGSSLTISGSISNGSNGAQTAFFTGSGTVILTGASDSLAAMNIGGGSLQIGNNGTTGTLGTASVNIAAPANLTFALTTSPTITNNITGTNGTVVQAGTGIITLSPSVPNTFGNTSGGLTVLSGGVKLGNANAVASGVFLNMSAGTLDLNSNSTTVGSLIGGSSAGTGGVITDTNSSAGTTTLTDSWAGAAQTYYGNILNGTAGRVLAFNKSGAGTTALGGSNTYTGGTNVTGGILEALTSSSLGTGTVTLSGAAGQLQIGNGVTLANKIIVNAAAPGIGQGALTTVTATDTATFTGEIDYNTATSSGGLIVGPGTSGLLKFTGPIIMSGPPYINVRGGIVQLADTTGNSSYSELIVSTTTLSLGNNNGIATNAVVQMGTSAAGTLDLNGYNQTVAGIQQANNAGIITDSNGSAPGNDLGPGTGPNGTSVLTVNTSATAFPDSAPDTYAGNLNSYVQLIKTGAGTLALTSSSNTYYGGTVIQQGVLAVAELDGGNTTSANGLGESYIGPSDLTFASPGGTLRYTGATGSTSRSFQINDGVTATLDVSTASAILTVNGSASVDGTENSNPASLAKGPGAGTLVLTGSYPYHGNTIVQGGTLLVTGTTGTTGYGAISILTAGTLGGTGTVNGSFNHTAGTIVGGASATAPTSGTLTFTGPMILNGGTDLNNINVASLSSSGVNQQGYITAAGGLSFGSTPETVSLQFSGTLPIGSFVYNLFDYTGTLSGTQNLTYTTNVGRATFTTDLSTPGEVNVDINNSGAANLFWNSTASRVWDVSFPSNASSGTANWYNAATNAPATKFVQGDNVTLADPGTPAGSGTLNSPLQTNINIASGVTVTPGSVTVIASSSNYTINGPGSIGGTGSLTLSGASTLSLAENNTYSGATNINGGVLSLQSSGSLGSLTTISFGGGTLQYSANNTVDYSAQFSTANNQLISIDTNGQNVTFAANLTSSGGTLTKLGIGTLTLTGTASTFNGGTNISNGTISTGVNIGASGSSVLVGANGNLLFAGTANIADSNNISGTGNVSNNQVTVITGDNSAFAGTWTANNQYSFNTAANGSGGVPATSANAAYVDDFAGSTNGMIFGTTGTYNLGSLAGVTGSEARAGNTGNPTVVLSVGNLNTSTVFSGTLQNNASTTATSTLALIKVGTGSLTLGAADGYTAGTTVTGGELIFAAPGALPNFTSLTIGANALAAAANHSTGVTGAAKNNLFVSTLSIAGATNAWTGTLDLANNDMDLQNGNLATTTNQVKMGYHNGTWNNTGGIISSSAAADTTHLTALGVIQNSVDGTTSGAVLYTSFDGATAAAATDVLVKYTYYGDANLDGKVDGTDYSRLDNGHLNGLTGWYNGDFNYDGVINGSDYTLIDNAYNTQGAQLSAELAAPTAQIAASGTSAASSAVPEPATLGLLGLGAVGLFGRRRRR